MSTGVTDEIRGTFAAIADVLIPEAEGMPSATQVGVHEDLLDRILGLRPDLREDFIRGIKSVVGEKPHAAAERLNKEDPAALGTIGLIASAGYYITPQVRELIGYPGQENRPADPDEDPEYVTNGMLQVVIDRGPIYVPTAKR